MLYCVVHIGVHLDWRCLVSVIQCGACHILVCRVAGIEQRAPRNRRALEGIATCSVQCRRIVGQRGLHA